MEDGGEVTSWLQLFASALLGAILGSVATLAGDILRQKINRPKLKASFFSGPEYFAKTPIAEGTEPDAVFGLGLRSRITDRLRLEIAALISPVTAIAITMVEKQL